MKHGAQLNDVSRGSPKEQRGPWSVLKKHQCYRSALLEVRADEVCEPDGAQATYEMVALKPSVTVLAMDAEEDVYLAREFRYALGQLSLEAVSGTIKAHESAEDAARRELREGLGFEAKELIPLGRIDSQTSLLDAPAQLFLARREKFKQKSKESRKPFIIVKLSLNEAVALAVEGGITHGASCMLLLRAFYWLRKRDYVEPG